MGYIFSLIEFGNFLQKPQGSKQEKLFIPFDKEEILGQMKEITSKRGYVSDHILERLAAIMSRTYSMKQFYDAIGKLNNAMGNVEKVIINYHAFSTKLASETLKMSVKDKEDALYYAFLVFEVIENHLRSRNFGNGIIQTLENNPFIGQIEPGEKRTEKLKIEYHDHLGRLPEDFQYINYHLNQVKKTISTCLDISHMITVIEGYTIDTLEDYPPRKLDEEFFEREVASISKGKSKYSNFILRMPEINLVHISDARNFKDDGNKVFPDAEKWSRILYTLDLVAEKKRLPAILELRGAHHEKYFHYATDSYKFIKAIYPS
jgi:hypothetical protein